uniref:K Homology domain-containing protein n=1 Tax=Timema cristinae TaxID=61476 RepID=A0A7R9H9H1_TIMCR|nr:unnamed protein product [Timema cristinae]
MDVIKPDLMWLEGCCFRITSSDEPYMRQQENLEELYAEDDEFDNTTCNSEELFDDFEVETTEAGRFRTSFHVPRVYFPYVIGQKGNTRRRLENETKTQIRVPKMGQDGDINLLWRKEVPSKFKEVLYRAYFIPIVTFATETWTLSVRETRKIEVMEMKFLKKMLAVTGRNTIKNEVTREIVGVQEVQEMVCNEDGNREDVEENVGNKSVGKILQGRPRKRWEEQIKESVLVSTEDLKKLKEEE